MKRCSRIVFSSALHGQCCPQFAPKNAPAHLRLCAGWGIVVDRRTLRMTAPNRLASESTNLRVAVREGRQREYPRGRTYVPLKGLRSRCYAIWPHPH
jgi:hypothetical protein